MIDHLTLPVKDLKKSTEFYTHALTPLGYQIGHNVPKRYQGFVFNRKPEFWITETKSRKISPVHLAFASTKEGVDAFYKAALAAGGKDNGAPGVRKEYHPGYYGAFVLDPDGHNIEAVCHVYVDPEASEEETAG